MQQFLSLGTGTSIYPTKVTAIKQTGTQQDERKVSVFFILPRWAGQTRHVDSSDMLFTQRHLGGDLERVVQSWFRSNTDLKLVHGALFGNVFNPNQYPENEFINTIQGLESFHRARMSNQAEPESAYKERKSRIKQMLKQTTPDDWKWIANKLCHANEPSLSTRLTELTYAFRELLPFLGDQERDWIIDSAADARNRMMHPEEGRPVTLSPIELAMINLILKLLTEGILLYDANVSLGKIPSMIARSKDYKRARALARRYIPRA